MVMAPELSRTVQIRSLGELRLGETAADIVVEASPAECARLAARLDVPAVAALRCRFRLSGADQAGRVAADGLLQATLTRICVATLEPFETGVAERFSVRFVPEQALDATVAIGPEDGFDLEADDDVPYRGASIDLGEAAVEQLALAMDPYPRRPGSELPPGIGSVDVPDVASEHGDPNAQESGADRPNPFAVLAGRRRSDN
jgi:uncharacterized metal-binding protein YceD (DUF177 family)